MVYLARPEGAYPFIEAVLHAAVVLLNALDLVVGRETQEMREE